MSKRIRVNIKPKSEIGSETGPEIRPETGSEIGPEPKTRPMIKVTLKKVPDVPSTPKPIPHFISIDVAIKTLAYCVMSETGYPIEWNVINLADGELHLKCSRQGCSRTGTFRTKLRSGKAPLCGVHHKSLPLEEKDKYERNLTVGNSTEYELLSALFSRLDGITGLDTLQCALIERQPKKARDKIILISHALFSYFVLKGVEVKFVDAKNKLTLYDGPPISCHLKDQYARNKWYGVKYCEYILQQRGYTEASELFKTFKKKDDPADCFLQGLWWITYGQAGRKAPITSAHQKLVYQESNMLKYNSVRSSKPKAAAHTKGRYTLSNIKYLVNHRTPWDHPALVSSIEFYFGSVAYFRGVMDPP